MAKLVEESCPLPFVPNVVNVKLAQPTREAGRVNISSSRNWINADTPLPSIPPLVSDNRRASALWSNHEDHEFGSVKSLGDLQPPVLSTLEPTFILPNVMAFGFEPLP
jgi:hypothetical protein